MSSAAVVIGVLRDKEKRLLPWEQIIYLKRRPYFERAALSRKENRKSQNLFPFVKMIEILGGVPMHLQRLLHVYG